MQVSVETTKGLERRMTVSIPEEQVSEGVQSRLKRLARTVKLSGFRPGKVPMKIVQQQYGSDVRREVVGDLMQSTFYEAVTQEKLAPAGMPTLEPKSMEIGAGLEYVATFEVLPEVKPAKLDGVKIDKPVVEVTEADVDVVIETIRKQKVDWKEIKRAAKDGDRVTIDFHGTVDGEDFGGNKGEGMPVILGEGRMIKGFEEGLKGAKSGVDLTLDLTFPEDYGSDDVAGKPVQFAIKVKTVEEAVLPEVTDELAKDFGIEAGTVEGLRAEVRQNMERELGLRLAAKIKQNVMDKLVEINKIDIPKALIEEEAKRMAAQMQQQMGEQLKGTELPGAMFEEQANKRVALGLLLSEMISENEFKAEPDKLRARVEEIASTYDKPEDVVNYYYSDKKRLAELESLVLEDTVVDWVLQQAKVNELKTSFDEIMNRA